MSAQDILKVIITLLRLVFVVLISPVFTCPARTFPISNERPVWLSFATTSIALLDSLFVKFKLITTVPRDVHFALAELAVYHALPLIICRIVA